MHICIQYIACTILHAKSFHSCLTLWNPMDCGLPSSSIHGVLQANTGWVVRPPLLQGSSQPELNLHLYVSCIGSRGSLPLVPPGKAYIYTYR